MTTQAEIVRLNPVLQGMTEEDQAIWIQLAFDQQYIDDRCTALGALYRDRGMGRFVGTDCDADTMLRHTEQMARESVANNPMYPAQRVYWQARQYDRDGAPRPGEPSPF